MGHRASRDRNGRRRGGHVDKTFDQARGRENPRAQEKKEDRPGTGDAQPGVAAQTAPTVIRTPMRRGLEERGAGPGYLLQQPLP